MYRRYYLIEVVILLLLSHGGWNGPSATLLSCTSESSKLVRDVIQKRFLTVVERYRASLPLECPLHPRRDMFWYLRTELEATRNTGENTWNCPVCGQKFRCESSFVTHWGVLHSKTLGFAEETVCLDDYCDVFRCDVLRTKMLEQRKREEEELKKTLAIREGRTGLNQIKAVSDDSDRQVAEKRKMCDPLEMEDRNQKCRSLIRQCTIGMLANMSSKDFQDIEDELDESICSFLTCDRYWDDYESQVHKVPVLILAIIGLIVTSMFCFCYYGTWVLIESNPAHHPQTQLCYNCRRPQSAEKQLQKTTYIRYRQNSPEFQTRRDPSRCAR